LITGLSPGTCTFFLTSRDAAGDVFHNSAAITIIP
jgi:hypothetical protein